tara:strand:+ start:96 stop:302 length:207 start_codon:yes stop_codon:yes gene_type:complete
MNITFYKYKITNKETLEEKLFFKYGEIKEYCKIPRSTLYKIFNGAKPLNWCDKFDFKQVRIPREMDLI